MIALAEGVRSLIDGYSPEDIKNARRIADGGEITPEDKERFIEESLTKTFLQMYRPSPFTLGVEFIFNLSVIRAVAAIQKADRELRKLSEDEMRWRIRNNAITNLQRWTSSK